MFAGIAAVLLAGSAAAFWLTRPVPPQPPLPIERQQPVRQVSAMDTTRPEGDLWDSVKDSGDAAAVRSYLAKYPGGTFAAAAKARLAEMDKAAHMSAAKPSFPCAGVSNPAQKLICADRALAALDVETASLYQKARENAVDTAPLADEQSAWLLRRDRCGSVECIRASYAQRRAEIGRRLGGGDQ